MKLLSFGIYTFSRLYNSIKSSGHSKLKIGGLNSKSNSEYKLVTLNIG